MIHVERVSFDATNQRLLRKRHFAKAASSYPTRGFFFGHGKKGRAWARSGVSGCGGPRCGVVLSSGASLVWVRSGTEGRGTPWLGAIWCDVVWFSFAVRQGVVCKCMECRAMVGFVLQREGAAMSKANGKKLMEIGPVTNGASETIAMGQPYTVDVRIKGTADLLWHRWNVESIDEKSKAAKGSKSKKTDDVESYCYRDAEGYLCLPGEYLRQSVLHAAKFRQDPRSPRKSAMDLFKAALTSTTPLARILVNGKPVKQWCGLHQCRVTIQRAGITRTRPMTRSGWEAVVTLLVLLPEYVSPQILNEVVTNAGRLIGVGDFRPTYGRFQIVSFDVGLE